MGGWLRGEGVGCLGEDECFGRRGLGLEGCGDGWELFDWGLESVEPGLATLLWDVSGSGL
jgi:hypothetical protein